MMMGSNEEGREGDEEGNAMMQKGQKIGVQMGIYLSDAARYYTSSNVWLRPNIKYDFSKYIYAQIGLKTFNGAAADWVEYGIGIRLGD